MCKDLIGNKILKKQIKELMDMLKKDKKFKFNVSSNLIKSKNHSVLQANNFLNTKKDKN